MDGDEDLGVGDAGVVGYHGEVAEAEGDGVCDQVSDGGLQLLPSGRRVPEWTVDGDAPIVCIQYRG